MPRIFDNLIQARVYLILQSETGIDTSGFDSGVSFFWMLLQTLLVLGFICLLAYVLLRLLGRHSSLVSSNSMVEIIDRIPLEQRKTLYVIKVTGRWLLIGSSEAGVQLISELDGKTAEQESTRALGERASSSASRKARAFFSDRLGNINKRRDQ